MRMAGRAHARAHAHAHAHAHALAQKKMPSLNISPLTSSPLMLTLINPWTSPSRNLFPQHGLLDLIPPEMDNFKTFTC